MNATIDAISTVSSSISPVGVFLIVFIILGISSFIMFKYFRYFCYGLLILVPIAIVSGISFWTANSYSQGNTTIFWFIIIAGLTVVISTGLGIQLSKFKWFKQIEKQLK